MNNFALKLLKAGLLVGTLDITSAFIYYFIRTGQPTVLNVLNYVASGLFGKAALTGGIGMQLAGLLLHYCIAFSFTIFFFWLFSRVKILSENRLLTGIGYGIFIWLVMNLIVVPSSKIGTRPFVLLNALINVLILIICIGIPLSFMATRFSKQAQVRSKSA